MKKGFKISCLIINLILIHSSENIVYSQNGWVQLNSGTTQDIFSLWFTDINTGYAAGGTYSQNSVVFLKTTNGGNNWFSLQTGDTNLLRCVYFKDSQTGFACGSNGTLLKTTNSGLNWNRISLGILNGFTDIHFFGNTGLLVGSGKVLRTTNDFSSWTTIYSGNQKGDLSFYAAYLITDMIGFYSYAPNNGGSPSLARTINGGYNWTYLFTPSGAIYDIGFANSSTGFAVSGGGNVYKTSNAGINWSALTLNNTYQLRGVSVIDANVVTVAGYNGRIYRTINGGINWTLQSVPTTNDLFSVFFVNADVGYAAGINGTILKTTTGGFTAIEQITNEIPAEYKLYQNYPNPFNPETALKFQIAKHSFVKLSVYNILGREIETLISKELEPGVYKVIWNASGFASGIYFYKLISENFSETKKLILTK